jgi:ATP-dependent Clp protease adaptor protein ClpS
MDLIEQQNPLPEVIEEEKTTVDTENKVVLFNDDWHTFEEVISQIIKAVNCTFEQARGYAVEAHTKGKAVVYRGSMQECLKVSSVLEEIALNTQIIG